MLHVQKVKVLNMKMVKEFVHYLMLFNIVISMVKLNHMNVKNVLVDISYMKNYLEINVLKQLLL